MTRASHIDALLAILLAVVVALLASSFMMRCQVRIKSSQQCRAQCNDVERQFDHEQYLGCLDGCG